MNSLQTPSDTTSAAGAMIVRQGGHQVVGFIFRWGIATSTASALPPDVVLRSPRTIDQTTTGATLAKTATAGAAIGELRRLSGLTWEQLARLFNVSRRSLHLWASGRPMAASNEEHLQRLLAVVRKVDRGSASANRSMLLEGREDGSLPFDMLSAREYDRVLALLGPGQTRRTIRPPLSKIERSSRLPQTPEALVDALQNRIHPSSGRLKSVKAISVPRRK